MANWTPFWKPAPFRFFKHYMVSFTGDICNTKTGKFLTPFRTAPTSNLQYVRLENKTRSKLIGVHKLVALTFGKMSKKDDTAIHTDYVQSNNVVPNLEASTTGDAMARTKRYNNEQKAKLRGIHKWSIGKNKWRALLSVGGMKVKTIGYYKTRREAIIAYYNAYTTQFKNEPFQLRDYV